MKIAILSAVALVACGSSRSPTPTPTPPPASAAVANSAPFIVPPFSSDQPAPPVCIVTGGRGFAAGHPLWSVSLEGQGSLLFVGDVDNTSLKVKPRLVVQADPDEDVAAFPGRPELLAVRSAFGTRLFSGDRELPALPDSGRLAVSPDGKLLAVRTFEALAVYDVATFTRRFSSPLEPGSDTIDFVGDDYVVCGGNMWSQLGAVIDQTTGKVLAEERGMALLSPSKKTLAILGGEIRRLRLLKLGPRSRISTIDVALTGDAMLAGKLVFEGTTYVDLVTHDRGAGDRVVARVATDTGALVPVPPTSKTPTSQDLDDGGNAAAAKDLETKARSLLPMDRSFVGQTLQRKRGFVGPTSTGFFAAGTAPTDPAASPSLQGLLIGNTLTRSVLHTVVLPAGFSIEAIAATTDERFVLVCGGRAGFFVDAVTGRTSLTQVNFGCGNIGSSWDAKTDGALFLTWGGMFDLASDEADPAWPNYLTPDVDACPGLTERR